MNITKILVSLLSFIILFASFPLIYDNVTKAQDDAKISKNVVVERGATWNKYRNPDGTYTLETYTGAINYQDENGTWRPINTSISILPKNHLARQYGYIAGNEENLMKVYFKRWSNDTYPICFVYDRENFSKALRSKLLGVGYVDPSNNWSHVTVQTVNSVQGQLIEDGGVYPNILYGTDARWIVQNGRLKEEITVSEDAYNALKNHPPSEYGLSNQDSWIVWVTKLDYRDVTPEVDGLKKTGNFSTDKTIIFKDLLDRVRFAFPVGRVYEQNNESNFTRIKYRLLQYKGEYYLLAGAPVTWFANAKYPVVIDPTTTVYSSSSDGYIYKEHSYYSTAHNGPSGTVSDSSTECNLGQRFTGSSHIVWRAFVFFDTSSIPDDATIASATLGLYGCRDVSLTEFYITIQNGQPTYPHDPLEAGDYYYAHYSGNGGSIHTSSFSTYGYNDISMTSEGISWINKAGTTKLCLRSDRDINNVGPTKSEYVEIFASEQGAGYQPRLVITYTTNNPPTISNLSPSNQSTSQTSPVTLSVTVSDQDGDTMDITFYNYETGQVIGTNNSVGNGTYTQTWNCGDGTFQWYVTVDDGTDNVSSDKYWFVVGDTWKDDFKTTLLVENSNNIDIDNSYANFSEFSQLTQIANDSFETDFGNWSTGNGVRSTSYAHTGSYSLDLDATDYQDFDIPTPDFSNYNSVNLSFWAYPYGIEAGDDLEIQWYDGSSWITIATYNGNNVDWTEYAWNRQWTNWSSSSYNFASDSTIRFKCACSSTDDDYYIDDVIVKVGQQVSEGNITSVSITKPSDATWSTFSFSVNNSAVCNFSIFNASNNATLMSNLANNSDISSITADSIKLHAEFNGSVSMDWWSVSWTTAIPTPDPPTGFTATTNGRFQIDLSWTKGSNADKTVIVYKTTGYPSNPSDGTTIYNDTGTSYSHTGLSPGTTYYYAAWSWNNTDSVYSSSSVIASNTTASNNLPTISNENPTNDSTGIALQPTCSVIVSDSDSDTLTVYFYENTTGSWILSQTNSSVSSGSSVSWTYTQADSYGTKYWWKVAVNDSIENVTTIYHFTTIGTPTITINFAGNLSDRGGPLYVPDENGVPVSAGYYTNASHQHEDYIYINCTITNATTVYLNWLNETTWTNDTYTFTNTGGNYWEINTSGLIQTCEGYNYSFDVKAVGPGGTTIARWEKTYSLDADDPPKRCRRYVKLNCSYESFDYSSGNTLFYLWDADNYTYVSSHAYANDPYEHDQGVDAGSSEGGNDVGMLKHDLPGETALWRSCISFVGYWLDEPLCLPRTQITNVYVHVWFNTTDGQLESNEGYVLQPYSRFILSPFTNRNIKFNWSSNHAHSSVSLTISNASVPNCDRNGTYTFYLTCTKLTRGYNISSNAYEDINYYINDNSLFNTHLAFKNTGAYPIIFTNRSALSFIIFNIPDNTTLQGYDSDSDGLNDYQELFTTYTNPFVADTDNDGHSDYTEYQSDTDPNNYTDYPTNVAPTISNEYPTNGSTNVDLQPTCHVDVSDADGDTLTVYFYENTTGSWVLRQTNSSISSGSTVYWTYTQANVAGIYYWKIAVNDSINNVTTIYHFTIQEFLWLNITVDNWNIGTVEMSKHYYSNATPSNPYFTADKDNCTVYTDLKLQITQDATDWNAATAGNGPGADIYRLNASSDNWVTEYQIVTASPTTIATNIPPTQNQTFDLRFDAPTSTSTGAEQTITVTATLIKH